MSKPKVYVTRKIPQKGLDILEKEVEIKLWEGDMPVPRNVLLEEVKEVDGLLPLLTDKIDREVIKAAQNLKVISNYAVGYDNIDVDEATKRGIVVTNTPGVLTESTADIAFTLLMAISRRIVESAEFVKQGRWKTWRPRLLLGHEIYGSTLGIIGLGRIGRAVVKRAKGFDMEVVYYSRKRKPEIEKEMGIKYMDLYDLLEVSDYVSLHVPLTDETKHLIDEKALKRMKSTSYLINTSRGQVVDQKALYRALVEKQIAGAGLDVTDPEPIDIRDPILKLKNVIVVPHIGSATVKTRNKMAEMAAKNLTAALKGKRPPYPVNEQVLK